MSVLYFLSFTYQSDMLVELYHLFPVMSIGKLNKIKMLANTAVRIYNLIWKYILRSRFVWLH